MTRAEWMLQQIDIQMQGIVRQLSGLPHPEKQIAYDRIMKQLEKCRDEMHYHADNPPPHLDKDGCVYWDSVIKGGK